MCFSLFLLMEQQNKRKRQTEIERLRIFGCFQSLLQWVGPHNEIGYSNKVLELIKHMYSVDHK